MAQKLMTPGVYIEEVNAFPGSVVEVATAIPAFIGYTEKASRNGKSLVNKPTRITSFAEYWVLFGGRFSPRFTLKPITEATPSKHTFTIVKKKMAIEYKSNNLLYLFNSIKLFFNNGGGTCYIVSVGTYTGKDELKIDKDELLGESKDENDNPIEGGLLTLLKEQEPTMVVIPDAVALGPDCYEVYKKVLAHCAKMQNRVAILDIFNGDEARIVSSDPKVDIIANFREKIGTEYLNYAAAYYPWLNTNIVQKSEVTFENLDTGLETLLPETEEGALELIRKFPKDDTGFIEALKTEKSSELVNALFADNPKEPAKEPDLPKEPVKIVEPTDPGTDVAPEMIAAYKEQKVKYDEDKAQYNIDKAKYDIDKAKYDIDKATYDTAAKTAIDKYKKTLIDKLNDVFLKDEKQKETIKLFSNYKENKKRNYHLGLIATSPTYVDLLAEITTVINLLPPSSAMAGIYTMVDNNRGVWKSPANVSVSSVVKPAVNITHDQQEDLNVNATSGKSINAIRTFPGIGTLVWGARTLDGNSLDWRYINVRRTMIMLEQSIKMALRSYVFEPNDANTWVTVKSMIVNFLTEKWKQGALAGSSPDDAFDVQIGLGTTMTSLDILEGKMLITVKLAIVRPAEFIVVTFEQQMQKS